MLNKKKTLIVISGPSGSGKSTLVKEVLSLYGPEKMGTLVSYTSRPPRRSEKEGCEYHFVSKEQFLFLKEKNFFAEWTYVYEHHYGTSIEQINKHWNEGRTIIKDFDLQGADAIKKIYPQALRVFIHPPSLEELKNRVYNRQENEKKDIEIRMEQAKVEIKQASYFDYQLRNANILDTIGKLKKIIEEYLKKA